MGLFNTLTAETNCANCKKLSVFELQFKYGETWQYHYTIGDTVNNANQQKLANTANEAMTVLIRKWK